MRQPPLRRLTRVISSGTLLCALLLCGCGNIQPWVKPYERDRLADPIMAWDRDVISGAYLDHIREAREGSRGATGGAGGGCGCN
jgi:hypothetical protein